MPKKLAVWLAGLFTLALLVSGCAKAKSETSAEVSQTGGEQNQEAIGVVNDTEVILPTDEDFLGDGENSSVPAVTLIVEKVTLPNEVIAINVPDEMIGSFTVTIPDGIVAILSKLVFSVEIDGTPSGGLANLVIYNEEGLLVAGLRDPQVDGHVESFDAIVVPAGAHVFTITGRVRSSVEDGQIVALTAHLDDWVVRTQATGQHALVEADDQASTVALSPVTVKGSVLQVHASSPHEARTISGGSDDSVFGYFIFDATNSPENIRISNMVFGLRRFFGDVRTVFNCRLRMNEIPLSSHFDAVYPTADVELRPYIFNMRGPLTIPAGKVRQITIVCGTPYGAFTPTQVRWEFQGASTYGADSGRTTQVTFTPEKGMAIQLIPATRG